MNETIVVGVDGSSGASAALEWAAAEAALRRAPLLLTHASRLLEPGSMLGREALERLREERWRLLESTREGLLRGLPELRVELKLEADDPAQVLTELSRTALMVVVGTRGAGGFERLLLGSVGLHVAAHGHCPVVVVPRGGERERGDRIVLGVDERHRESAAIGWAFAEADLRGAPLAALHAVGGFGAPGQRIGEQMELSEALAGRVSDHPDVAVEYVLAETTPARALVEASEEAALLVLGARRRRPGLGAMPGRVGHAVLHHSACPVVVVAEPGEG
ncbi:universal stress protein [Actinocorallia populi]|uniref:universal stress protein n=1 Tax=Actinocorallia populi TaxID=2079200 RepID=UPI0018E56A55|nr:universal stress protein [Actinocorallia populi]